MWCRFQDGRLSQPGYFITLPDEVQQWLTEQSADSDLSKSLKFSYDDGNEKREWSMQQAGVYDTVDGLPRYVYTLEPAAVGDQEIPVRLTYFDD